MTVARISCADYGGVEKAFRRALELLGGAGGFASSGEPVLVKPNLLAPYPASAAVTTHPAVVDAALCVAADLGARAVVADSPGFGSAEKVARACGIGDVCRRHGVPLLDLGDSEVRTPSGSAYRGLELAADALDAGRLWNVPKWKTHTMMGLTLGVKNLYGCVPGRRKVALHLRAGRDTDTFAAHLVELWAALRPCLTVLDGVVAMEGPGPSRGTPVPRGLLLASPDAAALDWEAARLSGFAPEAVPTVRLSLRLGFLTPETVRLVGDEAAPLAFSPAAGSPCDFPLPGFLKNLARGALSPLPRIDPARCTGCGVCVGACPTGALQKRGTSSPAPPKRAAAFQPPVLSQNQCIRCYCCQELCPSGAVGVSRGALTRVFSWAGWTGRRR